jgi:glycosyltransferase involved in cell wall biosynthesis
LLNWRDKSGGQYGGAEIISNEIASSLAAAGHDVTLFTSQTAGRSSHETSGKINIIRKGSVNTVYLFAFMHMLANRRGYDAVVESVNTVPFFSALLFRQSRVFILVHHIMGKRLFAATNPAKAAIAAVAEAMIPAIYSKSNFIVLSEFVRFQLESIGVARRRIHIVRIQHARIDGKREQKAKIPTVITVGRLVRQKRVGIIIRTIGVLAKKRGINAKLIIVGSGTERKKLEELVLHLGLEKNIIFTGFLEEGTKIRELKRAWVFATASLIEGLGLSAIEAELCSLPVVGFANGGLSESVKNGYSGFLVKEGNEKDYAGRLALLLSNKKTRERMGNNARKHSLMLQNSDMQKLIRLIEGASGRK